MRSLRFAVRSLHRQRGRALLGILGVAAAGALMFDMLLLSRGLLVSLGQLLDAFNFDVRVMASDGLSLSRPRLSNATAIGNAIARLPEVDAVVALRLGSVEVLSGDERDVTASVIGVALGDRRIWTLAEGRDLGPGATVEPEILINRTLAAAAGTDTGQTIRLRGRCGRQPTAIPPLTARVIGIATFPFDGDDQRTIAARLALLDRLCGTEADQADLLLVASRPVDGPDAAVESIRRARPDVHAFSNDEVIERFERVGFSYFRQISAALGVVTIAFGTLLITVLLSVSVNQRLGEIAALRAIGFTRRRTATDVVWQSWLLVGIGGVLAVPLGLALSLWLDGILRAFPGVPSTLSFFVFEPRALWVHAALLAAIACGGAIYPVWLVTRLPIATTLRNEIVS